YPSHAFSPLSLFSLFFFQLFPILNRPPRMRDTDRTAHEVGDGKHLKNLLGRHAKLMASAEVVTDAVIATEHHRSDETEQFLGLHVERAILVGCFIQSKKTVEGFVVLGEDFLV